MNNNIYYCTVSQTRGLSAEMPIGDPLGGPAYGKREMPVVIVALAAYSFAAGAAIATAVGATMASMVIGGAMMVGAALTVVGTVTGNQELTKIGGIMSLAGGVAGLAQGAFGAAAQSAAGGEAGFAGEAGGTYAGTATTAEGAASGATSGAVDSAAKLGSSGTDSIPGTAMNTGGPSVTDTSMPINDAAAQKAAADASAAVDPATNPFTATAKDTMVAQTPSTDSAFRVSGANDVSVSDSLINSQSPPPTGADGADGYFDKFGNFVKKNKELTEVGLKTVGGLIPTNESGSKTELNRAQTERIRQMTEDERRRAAWRRGLINY